MSPNTWSELQGASSDPNLVPLRSTARPKSINFTNGASVILATSNLGYALQMDGPGGAPAPPGHPHCFRLRRYGRRIFRPKNLSAKNFSTKTFSAETFSAENFSAENVSAENFSAEKISAENVFRFFLFLVMYFVSYVLGLSINYFFSISSNSCIRIDRYRYII